jgi:hypothetical protein
MVTAVGLLLVLTTAKPMQAASPEIVDNFNVSQSVQQTGIGSTFGVITDSISGNIIGQQREITVTVTAVGSDNSLKAESNSGGLGRLSHSQGTGVRGRTIIVWDGTNDGGAPGIDPSGLDVNLTADGNSAFVLAVKFSDAAGTIRITFFEDGSATTCSSAEKQLPSVRVDNTTLPKYLVFPYSQFSTGTSWGCTSAASENNTVGAIVVEIIGETDETAGWDTEIDFVELARVDYGDLPSGYAITTLANNGAGHVYNPNVYLGSKWDWEDDGQEDTYAVGDDNNAPSGSTGDDEEGVKVYGDDWSPGKQVTITVQVNGSGCLYAWVDWNQNNQFSNPDERIISATVTTGLYTYTLTVPSVGQSSPYYYFSRFRLTERTQNGNCPARLNSDRTDSEGNPLAPWIGNEFSGEVEDHRLGSFPTVVTLTSLKAKAEPFQLLIPVAVVAGIAGVLSAFVRKRQRH